MKPKTIVTVYSAKKSLFRNPKIEARKVRHFGHQQSIEVYDPFQTAFAYNRMAENEQQPLGNRQIVTSVTFTRQVSGDTIIT